MKQPFIIGLTGGIATGKSTTAQMFKEEGIPVFDADACVHELYAHDRNLHEQIETIFPGSVQNGEINRTELSRQLQVTLDGFARLNAIVHPAVERGRAQWLQQKSTEGHDLLIFDIPLLFETHAHNQVDAIVLVHAPASLQRQRAMLRPGMTAARFAQIKAQQMPTRQKQKHADYVIRTNEGLPSARLQVAAVLRHIRQTRITT